MRLGGASFAESKDPEEWAYGLKRAGYRTGVCPIGNDADDATVETVRRAAEKHDILIAEVGAWSNPISPDPAVRQAALEHCKNQLALADRIGARCCVNISGSLGEQWDGPHSDHFKPETFERIVDTVREIIDAVQPTRTHYSLETMPWALPDSADSYAELIRAIDRDRLGVHFDPVNMVTSPRLYYDNGAMIRDFFRKLGPRILNCHAKDIRLAGQLTVRLEEVVPGAGALDYRTFLSELDKLDPDTPLIIEHLRTEEQYGAAAAHIRRTAEELGISV